MAEMSERAQALLDYLDHVEALRRREPTDGDVRDWSRWVFEFVRDTLGSVKKINVLEVTADPQRVRQTAPR